MDRCRLQLPLERPQPRNAGKQNKPNIHIHPIFLMYIQQLFGSLDRIYELEVIMGRPMLKRYLATGGAVVENLERYHRVLNGYFECINAL